MAEEPVPGGREEGRIGRRVPLTFSLVFLLTDFVKMMTGKIGRSHRKVGVFWLLLADHRFFVTYLHLHSKESHYGLHRRSQYFLSNQALPCIFYMCVGFCPHFIISREQQSLSIISTVLVFTTGRPISVGLVLNPVRFSFTLRH